VASPENQPLSLCDILRSNFFLKEEATVKHLIQMSLMTLLALGVLGICSSPATAQDAASTFKSKCAMCHGADGKGGKMGTKDFASPDTQSQTDAQLIETITKGKPPRMPAYGGKISDAEIKDLVAYIRTFKK
jgi:cytochrome c6